MLKWVFLLTIFRDPNLSATHNISALEMLTETQCKPTSSVTLSAEQTTKVLVAGVLSRHMLTRCKTFIFAGGFFYSLIYFSLKLTQIVFQQTDVKGQQGNVI